MKVSSPITPSKTNLLSQNNIQQRLISLQNQLSKSKQDQKRYELQLRGLVSMRSKISQSVEQLASSYQREVKQMEIKIKKLQEENKKLVKKNNLYKMSIQNFQKTILEKDKIISTILAKQFTTIQVPISVSTAKSGSSILLKNKQQEEQIQSQKRQVKEYKIQENESGFENTKNQTKKRHFLIKSQHIQDNQDKEQQPIKLQSQFQNQQIHRTELQGQQKKDIQRQGQFQNIEKIQQVNTNDVKVMSFKEIDTQFYVQQEQKMYEAQNAAYFSYHQQEQINYLNLGISNNNQGNYEPQNQNLNEPQQKEDINLENQSQKFSNPFGEEEELQQRNHFNNDQILIGKDNFINLQTNTSNQPLKDQNKGHLNKQISQHSLIPITNTVSKKNDGQIKKQNQKEQSQEIAIESIQNIDTKDQIAKHIPNVVHKMPPPPPSQKSKKPVIPSNHLNKKFPSNKPIQKDQIFQNKPIQEDKNTQNQMNDDQPKQIQNLNITKKSQKNTQQNIVKPPTVKKSLSGPPPPSKPNKLTKTVGKRPIPKYKAFQFQEKAQQQEQSQQLTYEQSEKVHYQQTLKIEDYFGNQYEQKNQDNYNPNQRQKEELKAQEIQDKNSQQDIDLSTPQFTQSINQKTKNLYNETMNQQNAYKVNESQYFFKQLQNQNVQQNPAIIQKPVLDGHLNDASHLSTENKPETHNISQSSINKSKKVKRQPAKQPYKIISFDEDIQTPNQNPFDNFTSSHQSQNKKSHIDRLYQSQIPKKTQPIQDQNKNHYDFYEKQQEEDHQMHGMVDESSIQQIEDFSMISGSIFPDQYQNYEGERFNNSQKKKRKGSQPESSEATIMQMMAPPPSKKMSKKKGKRDQVQTISFVQ